MGEGFFYNKACVITFISNVIISFDKSSYERIGLNAGTAGVTEGQTNFCRGILFQILSYTYICDFFVCAFFC